jgi:sulfide:quinone oxidoreductase
MVRVVQLTPEFAVAGELAEADFAELAAAGFKSILANRPDGEAMSQLSAARTKELAEAAGLQFQFLPLRMMDVLEPVTAEATRAALNSMPGPILAFCRSGTRSAIAWAGAAATVAPVEDVIATLERADFAIAGLADELRARHVSRG